MNFDEALKEIGKEYNVRQKYENYAQIEFDELFDGYNYMYIAIRVHQGKVLLTDNAGYADLVDYDYYQNEILKLVEKYGLVFDDYYIEKEYHDNSDVKAYVDFLYELRDNYSIEVLKEKELKKFLNMSSKEKMKVVMKFLNKNDSIILSQLQMELWPILRSELLEILDKLVSEGYLSKIDDDYFVNNKH